MPTISTSPPIRLPDHTELPDRDGTFVKNDQEHPQSMLLTDTIRPVLVRRHPDGRYCIGQDLGIYWRQAEPPEPAYRGAIAPDWFYVPEVLRTLGGQMRRSYVLWQEWVAPLIVIELVSGDGSEERDRTPVTGKFWVYEQAIRVPFYAIYEARLGRVEVQHLVAGRYVPLAPNSRGHYEIAPMEVELGIWRGRYQEIELPWLRWWDLQGNLLPTSEERIELLAAQLRALGVEPQA
jgi:Uma2 family endonuclease